MRPLRIRDFKMGTEFNNNDRRKLGGIIGWTIALLWIFWKIFYALYEKFGHYTDPIANWLIKKGVNIIPERYLKIGIFGVVVYGIVRVLIVIVAFIEQLQK